jgi:PhnB protein
MSSDRPLRPDGMTFNPYLFFGGNCRDAFTRYQEIFGGELVLVTAQDMPPGEAMPGASPDLIMHAALTARGDLLMGSDDPTTDSVGPVHGMQVNYSTDDVDEATRVFTALADGGQVTMPLGATSFSPAFGMCVDRFGTPWMVSTDAPADAT